MPVAHAWTILQVEEPYNTESNIFEYMIRVKWEAQPFPRPFSFLEPRNNILTRNPLHTTANHILSSLNLSQ